MSDLLEDDLREQLHACAATADYLPIDAAAIITEGHRVRTRRRHRRLAGVAAVVLLAAAGTAVSEGPLQSLTTPSHRGRASAGTVVFTGLSATLGTPELRGSQTLRVDVDTARGRVTYAMTDEHGKTTTDTASLPRAGEVSWRPLTAFPNLVAGLAPASAGDLTDIGTTAGNGASLADAKGVPGTPYQAFLRLYTGSTLVNGLRGFLWVDDKGVARTTDPAVPAYSAQFSRRGAEPVRLVTVPAWDWMGEFSPGEVATKRLSESVEPVAAGVPRLELARPHGNEMGVTVLGLLPVGSTQVRATVAGQTAKVQTKTLLDAQGDPSPYAGFVAQATADTSKTGPWLTRLTWTDLSGAQRDSWIP